jgi:hypothetical protein
VKSTVKDESDKEEYQGIPKPTVAKSTNVKTTSAGISGFDGTKNTLPDDLDF